jgi:uncharacterized protein YbaR (Trm112 family)
MFNTPPWQNLHQLPEFLNGSWRRLNPPAAIHCPRCDGELSYWEHRHLIAYYVVYCATCDVRTGQTFAHPPMRGAYLATLYQPLYQALSSLLFSILRDERELRSFVERREAALALQARRPELAPHYQSLGFGEVANDRCLTCPLCKRFMTLMKQEKHPGHAVLLCQACRLEHYLGEYKMPENTYPDQHRRNLLLFDMLHVRLQLLAQPEEGVNVDE